MPAALQARAIPFFAASGEKPGKTRRSAVRSSSAHVSSISSMSQRGTCAQRGLRVFVVCLRRRKRLSATSTSPHSKRWSSPIRAPVCSSVTNGRIQRRGVFARMERNCLALGGFTSSSSAAGSLTRGSRAGFGSSTSAGGASTATSGLAGERTYSCALSSARRTTAAHARDSTSLLVRWPRTRCPRNVRRPEYGLSWAICQSEEEYRE
jgi:hypothetical protein